MFASHKRKAEQKLQKTNAKRDKNSYGEFKKYIDVRRCLPAGTLVHTTTGLVPIEQLKPSHKVQTHLGDHRVLAVAPSGKKTLLCITTEFGPLSCSEEHRMAVWHESDDDKKTRFGDTVGMPYIWKMAKNITANDKLVHIRQTIVGVDTKIDDIANAPKLTPKIAYFLGYAHGKIGSCIIYDGKGGETSPVGHVKFRKFIACLAPEWFKFLLDLSNDAYCIKSPSFASHMMAVATTGAIPSYILCAKKSIRESYLWGYESTKTIKKNVLINITCGTFLHNLQSLYASIEVKSTVDVSGATLTKHHTPCMYSGVLSFINPDVPIMSPVSILSIGELPDVEETFDMSVNCIEQFVVGCGFLSHNSGTGGTQYTDPETSKTKDIAHIANTKR